MASRSARALASRLETAADLAQNERLAAIEAPPKLCRSVLVSPSRFSSSAIFMLSPLFSLLWYRSGAHGPHGARRAVFASRGCPHQEGLRGQPSRAHCFLLSRALD